MLRPRTGALRATGFRRKIGTTVMNRSILIVICDFLLVSLLAFSTVDINKVADEGTQRNVRVDIVTNQLESGRDLTAAMKLALTEERKSRDLLLGELTKSRDVATQREKQVQSIQQALQTRAIYGAPVAQQLLQLLSPLLLTAPIR